MLATLPLLPSFDEESPGIASHVIEFAQQVAQGFLLTPVAIAVHRFVLLGEVTARYALNPFAPRFFLFLHLDGDLPNAGDAIPMLPMAISRPIGGVDAYRLPRGHGVDGRGALHRCGLLILFPAIAVDARGAHWRNAFDDTKGQTLRVIGAVMVAAIPFLIVMVPAYVASRLADQGNLVAWVAFIALFRPVRALGLRLCGCSPRNCSRRSRTS